MIWQKRASFATALLLGPIVSVLGLWLISPKPSDFIDTTKTISADRIEPKIEVNFEFTQLPERSAALRSWIGGKPVDDWQQERKLREGIISDYLRDASDETARRLGFEPGQTAAIAWKHFEDSPVGFNGLPYVLLKTLADLPLENTDPNLAGITRLWRSSHNQSSLSADSALNSLGMHSRPQDYLNGEAKPISERRFKLPYGFAWQSDLLYKELSNVQTVVVDARLHLKAMLPTISMAASKVYSATDDISWEEYRDTPVKAGALDRVHFSCAGCHSGRVMVDNTVKFLPGAPSIEVAPQLFSRLLMETAAVLVEEGFDPNSKHAQDPSKIRPANGVLASIHAQMIRKALEEPESFYGDSAEDIARAKLQVMWVSDNFADVIRDLISIGVKTHFIYRVAAENNGYSEFPGDPFFPMVGQMDAFGIASGLVALHMKRPDNSFMEFIQRDNPESPFLTGFGGEEYAWPLDPSLLGEADSLEAAAARIFNHRDSWLPKVPAPVDIKAVNWIKLNELANWDGNQGASSRTLSSGASATGDPRYVNVEAHAPLNPFINHLPPSPYPFDSVDLKKAAEGRELFEQACGSCHRPNNANFYTASDLQTDPNRSILISSVSRYGLSALVMEACVLGSQSAGYSADRYWCIPPGTWAEQQSDYFADTPSRVSSRTNGYKADPLFGIGSQAPYLHNGSVPTLAHLLCNSIRPKQFLRGSIRYDEDLVGFEWSESVTSPYSEFDIAVQRVYDTSLPGFSNGGHTYGAEFCPDLTGLDPHSNRSEIVERLKNSDAGKIIEYLKLR